MKKLADQRAHLRRQKRSTERIIATLRGRLERYADDLDAWAEGNARRADAAPLAGINVGIGSAIAQVDHAEAVLERAQVVHNVLCGCGWGRLATPWNEVPEFCPQCGWAFWGPGEEPEAPGPLVEDARMSLGMAARTVRATEAILRSLGALEAG